MVLKQYGRYHLEESTVSILYMEKTKKEIEKKC
jgi:hypothetical protein